MSDHDVFDENLAAYALGALPGPERGALREHLKGCDACRAALAELSRGAAALALAAPEETPPASAKSRLMSDLGGKKMRPTFNARPLALAASLAVAVAAGFALLGGPSPELVSAPADLLVNGAAPGAKLKWGDAVKTGENPVDLRIGNRAAVRLRPGSEVLLERKRGVIRLALARGAAFSLVRPGTKFQVRTPVTAASVRGTAFYVKVEDAARSYVCLCEGKLAVESPGLRQELAADHHNAVRLTGGPGDAVSEPAGMYDHTDEEMAELAALKDR